MKSPDHQQPFRVLYLDALRSLLMILGVVIHSAQLFRVYTPAEVELHPSSPFFDYLCAAIHSFRLPAFFLIAGYVGIGVIQRRGAHFFARRRLIRIGIPFVVALLSLNIVDAILAARVSGALAPCSTLLQIRDCVVHAFVGGNLRHLWFLPALMLYSSVLVGLSVLLDRVGVVARLQSQLELLGQTDLYLLVLPLWMVVTDAASWRLILLWERVSWMQIPSPDQLIQYAPFFFFGVIAQQVPVLWHRFGSTLNWFATANLGMLFAILLFFWPHPRISAYALLYLQCLAGWTLVGLVIRFGRFALDCRIPMLTESPDLAYSVYLFHHVFVTLFALIFLNYQAPTVIRFAVITVLTAALSIASHHVISRFSLLRFVFNGRFS